MHCRLRKLSHAVLALAGLAPHLAPAQEPPSAATVIFENVRIFDGSAGAAVGAIERSRRGRGHPDDLHRADRRSARNHRAAHRGGGRTLMPGLIDMHWHTMMVRPTPAQLLTGDIGHLNLVAGAEATATLMRGFTTVRDVGGPAFGLKRAIDEGTVAGPRIYPSGAIITVTSGHGDFRQPFEVPRVLGTRCLAGSSSEPP